MLTLSNSIKYGQIEGSQPKGLPYRPAGPHSMDLHIQDIIGTKAGTKGLGPFAQRARATFRSSITTQDIDGAQAGTIRTGISC